MSAKQVDLVGQTRTRSVFDAAHDIKSPLVAHLQSEAAKIVRDDQHPVRLAFEKLAFADLKDDQVLHLSSHSILLRKKSVVAFFAMLPKMAFFDLHFTNRWKQSYGFFRQDPNFQDVVFLNALFLRVYHELEGSGLAHQALVLPRLLKLLRAKWLHELAHCFIYQTHLQHGVLVHLERFDIALPTCTTCTAEENAGSDHSGRWLEFELYGGYMEIGHESDSDIDLLLGTWDPASPAISIFQVDAVTSYRRLAHESFPPPFDIPTLRLQQSVSVPIAHLSYKSAIPAAATPTLPPTVPNQVQSDPSGFTSEAINFTHDNSATHNLSILFNPSKAKPVTSGFHRNEDLRTPFVPFAPC